MGNGCESGASITFGATTLAIDPTRKLDLMIAAGSTGKLAKDSDPMVRFNPDTIITNDASIDTSGPLMAISNKAVLEGGKDLRGVIEPNVPT
mmetsp:Transcript_18760/g.35554  ORF Transcript_18760/g.35554 Transcript_18760/m.35554 type:complete len:92 (+) Transcript_18760:517-792(+)